MHWEAIIVYVSFHTFGRLNDSLKGFPKGDPARWVHTHTHTHTKWKIPMDELTLTEADEEERVTDIS